ncbi:MAG: hypothetical protein NT154_01295 [Verrucomicrobia bacterium]|nr:hypothetical protein [Verrucomicrobiota bacterium]
MRILRISLWVAPMAALTLQAAPFNVAFLPGTSPTYHNGTTFVGWDGQRYTALTEDPTAPFNDIPCIYRGYNQGGSSELLGTNRLVYRMRIDFANPVLLKSFTEVAAGGQNAGSLLRLLDGQMTLLKSVTLPRVMNALTTNVLNANVTGQSFIIDSFDCSLDWRFRRSFIIDHSPLNTGYATNIHSPVLHIRSSYAACGDHAAN